MSGGESEWHYHGDGRQTHLAPPRIEKLAYRDDPSGYRADEGLRDAVNVALLLGQPLLLTGEPGTGKTLLADNLAYELKAGPVDAHGVHRPLVFQCKTTSIASDLFYRYDALKRFHDAQSGREPSRSADPYITFEALGLAILLALPPNVADPYLPAPMQGIGPLRSVVLADEIDKAPRDLPNDVLNEIERMTFTVKETGQTFAADDAYKPILIFTSNSERDLPDAFLRRCVFYDIPFPDRQRMEQILLVRMGDRTHDRALFAELASLFNEIRAIPGLRKRPATAEMIAWARLLMARDATVEEIRNRDPAGLLRSLTVLGKSPEDRQLMTEWLMEWRRNT